MKEVHSHDQSHDKMEQSLVPVSCFWVVRWIGLRATVVGRLVIITSFLTCIVAMM